jgi:hypothetical protein
VGQVLTSHRLAGHGKSPKKQSVPFSSLHGKVLTYQSKAEWNQMVLTFGSKNEQV